MAICKMSLVSIIGPMKNIDKLVSLCGKFGDFQPDNVNSFYSNTDNFSAISEENPFSALLSRLKSAIYSCGSKIEDVDISDFQVSRSKIDKYVNNFSQDIENLVSKKRENYNKISSLKHEIKEIGHFKELDKTFEEILSCKYIKARFGKIPLENYSNFEKISAESEKNGLDLVFFEFDRDYEYQWGIYFSELEKLQEIDRIFSKMQFTEIIMKPYTKNTVKQIKEFEGEIDFLNQDIKNIDEEISKIWESQKEQCMRFYKKIEKLSTYFEIKSYASKYGNSFILVGWVPDNEIDNFKKEVNSLDDIKISVDKACELPGSSPPVKLKNSKFFKPFESLVSMYGMPCYNEIDPTVFVALTYPLLFGIMFADLGQGLLLALIGFIMSKFMNMKFGEIIIPCGISSAVFGTIFGSVFGFEHVLDPFYKNVFGLKEKPIEVMGSSTSNIIIYSAVSIGILLLICSMILGICSMIKRKNLGEALFSQNGLAGLIFYISAVYMLLDLLMIHSGIVSSLYITFLIVIPLILIMFKEVLVKLVERKSNWQPESWSDYISQSFFEMFEVLLSYVTNTMSFLRVGAFVLVHAGMMMVVFSIAQMIGGVGYYIALVFGNIFVIALEALLSGIQVLRLEFYEMFSKFFEGQGRAFTPVGTQEFEK